MVALFAGTHSWLLKSPISIFAVVPSYVKSLLMWVEAVIPTKFVSNKTLYHVPFLGVSIQFADICKFPDGINWTVP